MVEAFFLSQALTKQAHLGEKNTKLNNIFSISTNSRLQQKSKEQLYIKLSTLYQNN
jgi:hypothetical protein